MNDPHGEFRIIETIKTIVGVDPSGVELGIGDDAALCTPPKGQMVFCSDAMIEGTHFRLDWSSPEEIGHKALASCLSDIAAMNGKPLYALVSIGLRPDAPADFIQRFYNGAKALAARYGVAIVGGDLAKSATQIFIDVSIVGETSKPFKRSGANPGDLVVVTGRLGSAQAGLFNLQNSLVATLDPLRMAHVVPMPRFDVLTYLQTDGLVTSMIDISDGLASELHHVARASHCGFEIDRPFPDPHPEMKRLALEHKQNLIEWMLYGGESYELLFTVNPKLWGEQLRSFPELAELATVIGEAKDSSSGLWVTVDTKRQPLPDRGYNHFT